MPAVSTTPPTTISLAAIVLAVSRHVMKSAAHERNRQLMAFDNTLAVMKRAVVLLSGGVDSTTTLAVARERGFETYALTFRYGQRHAAEVEAARRRSITRATPTAVPNTSAPTSGWPTSRRRSASREVRS